MYNGMMDLVLKAQGFTKAPVKSYALLSPRQFQIATFMEGKKRVGTGVIAKHLGMTSGQVSVFMNVMCKNNVVSKFPKIRNGSKIYLYNLIVKNFELNTSGRGVSK